MWCVRYEQVLAACGAVPPWAAGARHALVCAEAVRLWSVFPCSLPYVVARMRAALPIPLPKGVVSNPHRLLLTARKVLLSIGLPCCAYPPSAPAAGVLSCVCCKVTSAPCAPWRCWPVWPCSRPQVCVPLHAMIRRWVLEGELDDPHGEFFVVRAAGVAAAITSAAAAGTAAATPPPLDLWNSTYQLHEERLPPFIGRPLAQRILRAGKAIHYLNLACGDGGWVQQRAEALAARVEAVGLGGRPGGSMDAEVRTRHVRHRT